MVFQSFREYLAWREDLFYTDGTPMTSRSRPMSDSPAQRRRLVNGGLQPAKLDQEVNGTEPEGTCENLVFSTTAHR